MHLGMVECRVPFTGHCYLDLASDLVLRIIMSGV